MPLKRVFFALPPALAIPRQYLLSALAKTEPPHLLVEG